MWYSDTVGGRSKRDLELDPPERGRRWRRRRRRRARNARRFRYRARIDTLIDVMRVIEFSNHSFWLHLRTERWAKHRVGNYGPPSPKRAGASRPRDRGVRFKYLDRPNSLEVTGPFEKPEGPGLASVYIYIYIHRRTSDITTPSIYTYIDGIIVPGSGEKNASFGLTWENRCATRKNVPLLKLKNSSSSLFFRFSREIVQSCKRIVWIFNNNGALN